MTGCTNHVTQDGLKVKLCIFLTRNKGYGVRPEEPIPKGTFVGVYGGVPKHARNLSKETRAEFADRVGSKRYRKYQAHGDVSIRRCQDAAEEFVNLTGSTSKMRIFANDNDIDLHEANNGDLDILHWLPENDIEQHNLLNKQEKIKRENEHHYVTGEFVIDSAKYGTVCRYFNHTCGDETVVPQLVYDNRQDQRLPTIAFFTRRDIEYGEELVWNYNLTTTDEEKANSIKCYCQSTNCQKTLIRLNKE